MRDHLSLQPRFVIFAFIALVLAGAATAAPPILRGADGTPSLAPLLERVTPAVVNISVVSETHAQTNPLFRDPFFRRYFDIPDVPQTRRQLSAGSGVIVNGAKGYVITNHHVVKNATRIVVTLKDRRQMEAKLIGGDPATDIALLKIKPDNLVALPFGDSDALKVGDIVVAIGNPFGLGQTVTSGIVSAKGRTGLKRGGYEDYIQTDASINPGNSGGALVNLRGELIGINTAIIAPAGGNVGIGFAVPSAMAKAVMGQLLQHGKVQRGQLGILIQDLTPGLAKALKLHTTHGAVIREVVAGSSAEKAGLKAGDVVIEFNGRALRSSSDLRNRVGLVPIGSSVTLTILRDGKGQTITAHIGEARAASLHGRETISALEGATFQDGRGGGVLVAEVGNGSPAWQNGLRPGDEILSINRRRVRTAAELKAALVSIGPVIALDIRRGDGRLLLVIQ
jgi:Do/DeqQ family serine protease